MDHPASQQAKITKLKPIFGRVPEHVTYVPVDFNHETLEKLLGCGYEEHLKTLFIWEGVTYYITAEAVDHTLAFVTGHSGAGSSIIFDYTYSTVIEGTQKRGEMTSARRYARFTGEGWRFGISEGTVETFLEQRGFHKVKNATSQDLKRLYFTGVNQKREAAPVYAIVHATVKPR